MNESLITIRVPRELREKMRRAGINWSEELRRLIRAQLEAKQKLEAEKEVGEILKSVKPGFDTLKAIKEDRRHG